MAFERDRATLASSSADGDADTAVAAFNGGDDGGKTPRLPRWTRQEILVLIQGKRVAENRVRRGRTAGLAFGSGQVEPKWASVSSYCKRHGVNRGPVQCRKRWSNLAGDFKKIKEWESQTKEEADSFWVMRNDLRRERKLPGFFDKEVYDILDGGGAAAPVLALALAPAMAAAAEVEKDADCREEAEALFDSGRSAAADDGLFSDFEPSMQEDAGGSPPEKEGFAKEGSPKTSVSAPVPISEKQYQPFLRGCAGQGTVNEKQPTSNAGMDPPQEGRKRKRLDEDEDTTNLHDQLVEVLERNGRMLNAQLEAQNTNCQMDREQRKNQADSFIAVLNKVADALVKIAEKL